MGKMTPGYKFSNVVGATVLVLLSCSLFGNFVNCAENGGLTSRIRTLGVVGIIFAFNEGNHVASAYPPQMFQRRLGAPMPELGHPESMEDEDSEEDDDEGVESGPRLEPHITPLNRDQCLAKLLCGMSVPVTGGNSKKNYYSEYANIVSKFFEAFPLDDEIQSKESMESYDDYSNEDDGKPSRTNSKRKPLNSSRADATTSQPPLQLFELALVDVAKPEDLRAQNRTKKEAISKVSRGNRTARARKIVENLGQKLQTVRQCQSINGCPFSFKQLRETLKRKEAERVSSKVPLPGPIWPPNSKRKEQPAPAPYKPKPYVNHESRPKPGSFAAELFSQPQENEKEPIFPHRDTNKGDDELEEIFGPPKVSKRPLGFHQGVDENFNYEYNSEKPWRPGQSGGNSYNPPPWQARPRPKPFNGPGPGGNGQHQQRPPPRPRPQNGPPGNQRRPRPPPPRPGQQQQQQHQQKRKKPEGSPLAPMVVQQSPKRPNPPAQVTTTKKPSPFPKRKISYLNSPYKKPSISGEDDEGTEDINKVAPIEFVGNSDAGEYEPPKKTTTTTEEPEGLTEAPTTNGKKKNKNNEDSDEYDEDEDDYYDDEYDGQEDEEEEEDEEDYSDEDEEEDEKSQGSKDNKEKKRKRKKQKNKKNKNKRKKGGDKNKEVETVADDEPAVVTPKTSINRNKYYDDENEAVDEIWTKLNFATTGANYKPPAKLKKKEKYKISSGEGESDEAESAAVSVKPNNQKNNDRYDDDDGDDDDDEDEEDDIDEEEEGLKGSLTSMQKIRASSSSASNEDDADDEVDDENQSKRKKSSKTRLEARPVEREETYDEERPAPPSDSKDNGNGKTKKSSNKKSSKNKKKKKAQPSSNEENEEEAVEERRKNIMMEIGGRPLVPKPDHNEKVNAHKTSSLIANRFKLQFINPYGAGPPQGAPSPMDLPGSYSAPLRTSYGPNSEDSPPHSNSGNQGSGSSSGLPFKFKLNPGPLGNLAGGPGGPNLISLGGFGNHHGPPSSMDMPDPHHPPPPTPFMPQNHGPNTFSRNDNDGPQQHFSRPSGFSASGMGSSLFKLNPLPALSKLFKTPSHDSMHEGHSAPPINSFIHRPVGPESSNYRRDKLSPASGSSNPSKKKGSKGSSTKKSKGKGKKEKL